MSYTWRNLTAQCADCWEHVSFRRLCPLYRLRARRHPVTMGLRVTERSASMHVQQQQQFWFLYFSGRRTFFHLHLLSSDVLVTTCFLMPMYLCQNLSRRFLNWFTDVVSTTSWGITDSTSSPHADWRRISGHQDWFVVLTASYCDLSSCIHMMTAGRNVLGRLPLFL